MDSRAERRIYTGVAMTVTTPLSAVAFPPSEVAVPPSTVPTLVTSSSVK